MISSWVNHFKKIIHKISHIPISAFDEGTEAMFGGTNYFISSSWMDRSYSDARTYCQYHGADLALITSENINVTMFVLLLTLLIFFRRIQTFVLFAIKWIISFSALHYLYQFVFKWCSFY